MQHIIFVAFGSVEFGKKKRKCTTAMSCNFSISTQPYFVALHEGGHAMSSLAYTPPPTFVIFGDWEGSSKLYYNHK